MRSRALRASCLLALAALALVAAAGSGAATYHDPAPDGYGAADGAPDAAVDAEPAEPEAEAGGEHAAEAPTSETDVEEDGSADAPAYGGGAAASGTSQEAADAAGPEAVQYGGQEEPSDEARGADVEVPGAGTAGADVEALADRGRCEQDRIMGVYARWSTTYGTPDAAPHNSYAEDGRWYWGVNDPQDHPALDCGGGNPSGAATAAPGGPAFAPVAGAEYAPTARGAPAGGGDAGAPTSAGDVGEVEERPPPGGEVNTAGAQIPPAGPPTTGAVALALAAAAIPAAVALYRKLTREGILENETRKQTLELVMERPGLTTAEVAAELDVHYRTARHHLEKLEEFDKIVGKRLRGRIRYFENHERFGRIQKRLISCFEADTKEAIIMEIARSGAVRSGEVADRVDVAPSTASHHLGDLEEMDLVSRQRDGRSILYSLADGVMAALLEVAPSPEEESGAD